MRVRPISTLYIANFLTGLVFWYGIEKLFMQHVGIDAVGIGIVSAMSLVTTIVLDIPSGMIADRWSRKKLLMLGIVFLALSTVLAVTSHGHLWLYIASYVCYGCYLVCISGTYQALTYDILHEEGRAKDYTKIMGREYAAFLIGAAVANALSGFIATISITLPFWLTLIPCALNMLLLAHITEPTFHKKEQQERFVRQVRGAAHAIVHVAVLRCLAIIWCAMAVSEVFKQDFSQLYMLQFTGSAVFLGFLWAGYAVAWALGSTLAHRLKDHLGKILIAMFCLTIALGLVHSVWGLVLFMLQAVLAAAVFVLIETQVQDATPSAVRASILSVLSTAGQFVALPSAFVIGWLIRSYDVFWALRLVAAVSILMLLYWLMVGHTLMRRHRVREPLAAHEPEML